MNWLQASCGGFNKFSQIIKDPSGSIIVTIPVSLFGMVYDKANFDSWDDYKEDRYFDIDKDAVDYHGMKQYETYYMSPMMQARKDGNIATIVFQNDAALAIFEEALFDVMEMASDYEDKKTVSAIRAWLVESGIVVPFVKPEGSYGCRPDFKHKGVQYWTPDPVPYSTRQQWPDDQTSPPETIQ